ncbi:hypothetical protein B0P06_003743 [Clostridium saccharoperbutylacetonicum]|uniref:Uncharacterized protein n=1 Tax=Clostridium saccharoperbutylacetonicum N1-4(HMT) TaxID=931276 RepID=M1N3B2_9CLOT|nr:hypothetical protein [Clostridium saccharoperbutylacetonicum]AGF57947.1 hypothetical protein Cspa_c41940 [Clostridium saccharoperbutylacetonicum N1-4(HMT)]NRT61280.1 hypothetical protein [Clostridium saccharoperbutylacetonicum]NSB24597.1 hypothetical protein [Clostridium saccharoperbutylacetonicum]NSB43972.1 hypothetical protein [Clostridium saccharoperbutylacetonicum]
MKKQLTILIFILLIVSNIVFISATVFYKTKMDNQVLKVYSFAGENNDIKITNGIIVISTNRHMVGGGEILYIGSRNDKIKAYSEKIYLKERENNDKIVLHNSVESQGDIKGTFFSDEFLLNKGVGSISSEKLFSEDEINNIKDNLYFSLDYSKVNGEKGNYTIKLNLNEIK